MSYFVYLLRLSNDQIYVGLTKNLERRLQEHHSGSGCKTTSNSSFVDLIHSECFSDLPSARAREQQLKRWSKAKKLALAEQRFNELHELAKSRERTHPPESVGRSSASV